MERTAGKEPATQHDDLLRAAAKLQKYVSISHISVARMS